jgi:hypothetical protein
MNAPDRLEPCLQHCLDCWNLLAWNGSSVVRDSWDALSLLSDARRAVRALFLHDPDTMLSWSHDDLQAAVFFFDMTLVLRHVLSLCSGPTVTPGLTRLTMYHDVQYTLHCLWLSTPPNHLQTLQATWTNRD